jgi:hypothetical protein
MADTNVVTDVTKDYDDDNLSHTPIIEESGHPLYRQEAPGAQ